MAEGWICADCLSYNSTRANRCYKCAARRSLAAVDPRVTRPPPQRQWTVLERAERIGAAYRPTWPLAVLLLPLIMAAVAARLVTVQRLMSAVNAHGAIVGREQLVDLLTPGAVGFVVFLASLLVWSIWIALVVRNIPALTALYPHRGPLGAFVAAWIPIVQLWRPYGVVRSTLAILSGGQLAPMLIALAWWLTFLASYVVPSLIGLSAYGQPLQEGPTLALLVSASGLGTVFYVIAGVFAAAVVVIVEREQMLALERRSATAAPVTDGITMI